MFGSTPLSAMPIASSRTLSGTVIELSISDNLTLTDSITRVFEQEIVQTLTLSQSLDGYTLNFSFPHTLDLSDSVVGTVVHTTSITDTLVLSDSVVKGILETVSSDLTLTHGIDVIVNDVHLLTQSLTLSDAADYNLETEEDGTHTLTLSDSIEYELLSVKNVAQSLTLTDSVTESVFQQQNLADTLELEDFVQVEVFSNSYSLIDNLELTHRIEINVEYNLELCSCLHLTQLAEKVTEVSAENTLTLSHSVSDNPGSFVHTLTLSDSVTTNAITTGDCCPVTYLPDKDTGEHTLTLSDSITLQREICVSVIHSLNLRQTVAYIPGG